MEKPKKVTSFRLSERMMKQIEALRPYCRKPYMYRDANATEVIEEAVNRLYHTLITKC